MSGWPAQTHDTFRIGAIVDIIDGRQLGDRESLGPKRFGQSRSGVGPVGEETRPVECGRPAETGCIETTVAAETDHRASRGTVECRECDGDVVTLYADDVARQQKDARVAARESVGDRSFDAFREGIEAPVPVAESELATDVACDQDIDTGQSADRFQERDVERREKAARESLLPLITPRIPAEQNDHRSTMVVHHRNAF